MMMFWRQTVMSWFFNMNRSTHPPTESDGSRLLRRPRSHCESGVLPPTDEKFTGWCFGHNRSRASHLSTEDAPNKRIVKSEGKSWTDDPTRWPGFRADTTRSIADRHKTQRSKDLKDTLVFRYLAALLTILRCWSQQTHTCKHLSFRETIANCVASCKRRRIKPYQKHTLRSRTVV